MRCFAGRLGLAASQQHAVIVDPLAAFRERDLIASPARDYVDYAVWHWPRRRQAIQESDAEAALRHEACFAGAGALRGHLGAAGDQEEF